ncbi:biotin protein ligase [Cordyceps javanica]|uniref:Biotin protein ligase n=1 Tax=Cordyceps javanica TaxID=43265 RepID=A0A545UTB0_9HYPO|nr:biotin protein ligase [Cordyceps javanica]TQW03336.1 biotin protein ligase [Cordyceps javanica]
MAQLIASAAAATRPGAFVYRGPKDDPDLSLAVGQLLESSSYNFTVKYVGPKNITAASLKTVKVFAFPGGPDVDDSWAELEPVADDIRDFVANGGRYLGFCLGAYIAGHSPGLGLLPNGTEVVPESDEADAQVKDDRDTVIQVDWAFSSGPNAGSTVTNRWVYYQEGNTMKGFPETSNSRVLARYSTTNHVAATLNKHGEGWVGTTGPHPEANQLWFDVVKLKAPDGLQFEIGHDLIEAAMSGGENVKNLAASDSAPSNTATDPPSSSKTSAPSVPTSSPAKSGGSIRAKNPFRFLFRR